MNGSNRLRMCKADYLYISKQAVWTRKAASLMLQLSQEYQTTPVYIIYLYIHLLYCMWWLQPCNKPAAHQT